MTGVPVSTTAETRDERVVFRATDWEVRLLRRAANAADLSLSAFVRDAARDRAARVLQAATCDEKRRSN